MRWFVVLSQRTTPVLLCTLYYKVLPQYYSVLHSTTPVLLSNTTTYYSVLQSTTYYYPSTTLYYKVLRQYYSVLRQYYNLLPRYYFETSFTMCGATRVSSASNFTKYCACHARWMSPMICVTYETSYPMRGASQVTLQPHQILRLPRNVEAQDFSRNSLNASTKRKRIQRYPRISEDKIVISHPPLRAPYSSHFGDDFVL